MCNLSKQALLLAADLSLPKFQVISMDADLGCAHCRQRLLLVITKLSGSKEFDLDVCRKQVIVKGGIRIENEADGKNVKSKTGYSSLANKVRNFIMGVFEIVFVSSR